MTRAAHPHRLDSMATVEARMTRQTAYDGAGAAMSVADSLTGDRGISCGSGSRALIGERMQRRELKTKS